MVWSQAAGSDESLGPRTCNASTSECLNRGIGTQGNCARQATASTLYRNRHGEMKGLLSLTTKAGGVAQVARYLLNTQKPWAHSAQTGPVASVVTGICHPSIQKVRAKGLR